MRLAARRLTQYYEDVMAPTGLRITQYSLMVKVDRFGVIPMTALAEELEMDRTTLTRNLAPLRRQGFVSVRSAGGGRTKLVTLTQRGRDILLTAYSHWLEAQQFLRTALGPAETTELRRLAGVVANVTAQRSPTAAL
jgi:DNA-binding MarR family transcriptional regulator